MTLKAFIEYFQQDLNDPASTLMAIEKTMRIMKEERNTEINASIGGLTMRQISNQFLAERSDDMIPPVTLITVNILGYDDNVK